MLARPMRVGGGDLSEHLHSAQNNPWRSKVLAPPPHLEHRVRRPERAMYLWNYFASLSEFRDYDSFSGQPRRLKPADVLAWSSLLRTRLAQFEIQILFDLDRLFLKAKLEELANRPETKLPKGKTK